MYLFFNGTNVQEKSYFVFKNQLLSQKKEGVIEVIIIYVLCILKMFE